MSNISIYNPVMGTLCGFSQAIGTFTGMPALNSIERGFSYTACPFNADEQSGFDKVLVFYGIAIGSLAIIYFRNSILNAYGSLFPCCLKKPAQTQSQLSPETASTTAKVNEQATKAKLQPQKNPDDFAKAVAIANKAGEKGANARAKLLDIHAKYSTEIQGRKDIKEAFARLSAGQGQRSFATAQKA